MYAPHWDADKGSPDRPDLPTFVLLLACWPIVVLVVLCWSAAGALGSRRS